MTHLRHRILLAALAVFMLAAPAYAATAFLTGEVETGMTKQYIYDFAGSTYTITIDSYKLCPLTIEVR